MWANVLQTEALRQKKQNQKPTTTKNQLRNTSLLQGSEQRLGGSFSQNWTQAESLQVMLLLRQCLCQQAALSGKCWRLLLPLESKRYQLPGHGTGRLEPLPEQNGTLGDRKCNGKQRADGEGGRVQVS